MLTLVGNPHRTLSAVVPDSFSPWAYVSPQQMLNRRQAALQAVALIPSDASVAANTPLVPLLAEREAVIVTLAMFITAIVRDAFNRLIGWWPSPGTTRRWPPYSRVHATDSSTFGRC